MINHHHFYNQVFLLRSKLDYCSAVLSFIFKSYLKSYRSSVFYLIHMPPYVGIEIFCTCSQSKGIWQVSMTQIVKEGSCFVVPDLYENCSSKARSAELGVKWDHLCQADSKYTQSNFFYNFCEGRSS